MNLQERQDQYQGVLSDPKRLAAIRDLELTDSPAEEVYDRLTRLASRLIPVPVALVSIVDGERQFFKSLVGLKEPWASLRQTPLTHSFCQHVVVSGEPLIVENAREHPLVHDNLAIPDLGVVSYFGMPLTTRQGITLGTFCVIDTVARQWSEHDIQTIRELARSVMTEIELRNEVNVLKAVESNLRRSEERFRHLIEIAPGAILVIDASGQIVLANKRVVEYFGYPHEELVGRAVEMLLPEPLQHIHEAHRKGFFSYPEARPMGSGRDLSGRRKDGSVFPIEIGLSYTMHEGETLALAFIADMTVLRQAQEAAFDAALDKERNVILSEFVQDALHEFRTPITTIRTSTYLINKTVDESSRQRHADTINIQVDAMARLIDDMMLMWKLDHNYPFSPSKFDIRNLVRQTIQEAQGLSHHVFELECQEAPISFYGDNRLIAFAYRNILQNAIDHSPDANPITTRVLATDEDVVIEIQDRGRGMDADELKQIFKRFYRGDDAHNLRGFGLGLPIAQAVTRLHEGRLEVSSSKNQGTIASIRLPRREH